jgi:hypothetical protein
MSKITKSLLWQIYDMMTQELDDLYKFNSRNPEEGPKADQPYYPRPMTERMNLLTTLVELQGLIEHQINKTGDPYAYTKRFTKHSSGPL